MNDQAKLRKLVCTLLITVVAGAVAGRILATERIYEPSLHRDESDPTSRGSRWPTTRPRPMPTFSSNDRARWATIRALVDGKGTFIVGQRHRPTVFASAVAPLGTDNGVASAALALAGYQVRTKSIDSGIIFEDGYQSVDKVLHPQTFDFYSTKPPLLPVLIAGLYWLLQLLTGWTLADDPAAVVRTILLLVNLLPFMLYLVLIGRLVERYGKTDWGRLFVMTSACFATYVTTFATTLSNHLPATFSVLFAMYAACLILEEQGPCGRLSSLPVGWKACPMWCCFAICGLFSAFAVCNEFPALSFAAAMFVILLRWAPKQTLLFFVPPAAVVAAAFFWTNYQATGGLRPIQTQFDSVWYQYEGSHWRKPAGGEVRTGIDWAGAQESRLEYAFHVLIGHHGLFSLTPIWLLALAGMFRWSHADVRYWLGIPTRSVSEARSSDAPRSRFGLAGDETDLRGRIQSLMALLTLLLTVVVLAFYLYKSDNYGGFTSGLRWLMWLTPLWLFTMLPIADHVGDCRWGRRIAYVLLAFSVLSVSYPAWNPWRHPWLYNLMVGMGWPGY